MHQNERMIWVERIKKVYAIQHNNTKRIYIGSSINPEERYMSHIYSLRKGNHPVEDMQEDFNKYGENLSFYILDECHGYEERKKEYEWMRKYNTTHRGVGYNYKDHEKAYSAAHLTFIEGLPMPFSKSMEDKFMNFKTDLINKIHDLVMKSDDLSLLDLVCKVLEKATIETEE